MFCALDSRVSRDVPNSRNRELLKEMARKSRVIVGWAPTDTAPTVTGASNSLEQMKKLAVDLLASSAGHFCVLRELRSWFLQEHSLNI